MVRVLFFGTPAIAVPYLDWLIQHTTVVGAVCRPDEPVGRGYTMTPPPTKVLAEQKGVPVFQPKGPWEPSFISTLRALNADVGIVVAYGRIMPEAVFSAPRLGCANIHFSLLPRYRGAAPMQWSLINGETKTGVTAFWIEAGLDSGPIAGQIDVIVDPEDDAPRLREKLVPAGISVMERLIADVAAGTVKREPQTGEPSLAPLLTKETGRIDWARPAADIVNLIRGVVEWPGAQARFEQGGVTKTLKIMKASVDAVGGAAEPGTIVDVKKESGFVVKAGADGVLVREVQPEGKKRMPAWSFWQGAHLSVGDRLG